MKISRYHAYKTAVLMVATGDGNISVKLSLSSLDDEGMVHVVFAITWSLTGPITIYSTRKYPTADIVTYHMYIG